MSNMSGNGPGSTLHNHESVHVLQNRIFGPVFTLGYLAWMAVLLVPAAIAGMISRDPDVTVSETILWWCYYDNPWEVWAYTAENPTDRQHLKALLCWPPCRSFCRCCSRWFWLSPSSGCDIGLRKRTTHMKNNNDKTTEDGSYENTNPIDS
jgi:hypothetical protein